MPNLQSSDLDDAFAQKMKNIYGNEHTIDNIMLPSNPMVMGLQNLLPWLGALFGTTSFTALAIGATNPILLVGLVISAIFLAFGHGATSTRLVGYSRYQLFNGCVIKIGSYGDSSCVSIEDLLNRGLDIEQIENLIGLAHKKQTLAQQKLQNKRAHHLLDIRNTDPTEITKAADALKDQVQELKRAAEKEVNDHLMAGIAPPRRLTAIANNTINLSELETLEAAAEDYDH